jgi:hypothetical protein
MLVGRVTPPKTYGQYMDNPSGKLLLLEDIMRARQAKPVDQKGAPGKLVHFLTTPGGGQNCVF